MTVQHPTVQTRTREAMRLMSLAKWVLLILWSPVSLRILITNWLLRKAVGRLRVRVGRGSWQPVPHIKAPQLVRENHGAE